MTALLVSQSTPLLKIAELMPRVTARDSRNLFSSGISDFVTRNLFSSLFVMILPIFVKVVMSLALLLDVVSASEDSVSVSFLTKPSICRISSKSFLE